MRATRRAGMAVLFAMLCGLASAQGFPAKPIRLVVPFPAGGATDIVARTVAQQVALEIGQQLIVDNRAGAGGSIGSNEVAKATPDGYTLLLTTSSTHSIGPHLLKLPYDTVADFTPIVHLVDAANLLLISPQLPVKTVPELIAYARANPGKLNYASSGNGTIVHLTSEAFKAQAGVSITHVPYKGTGAALSDLVSGNVQLLFDSIPSGMANAKQGRVHALAVTGPKRSPLAPDLPTLSEAGLPGFESVTWFGLFGPKGMKPELVQQLHDAFDRAVHSPQITARLAQLGADAAPAGSPAQFAAVVQADSARWAKLIKERHITLD